MTKVSLPQSNLNSKNYETGIISNELTVNQRIQFLSSQILPLTKPFADKNGNTIQLWSATESQVVGTIVRNDGSMRFVSSVKTKNALCPDETSFDLHMRLLLAPSNCDWDYQVDDNCVITIWPQLKAAGWKDAIPSSETQCGKVNALFRGKTQERACEWFYSNGYQTNTDARVHLKHPQTGKSFDCSSSQHEVIKNCLRSGLRIEKFHFGDPSPKHKADNFFGNGVAFQHPRDKKQTQFNVDFTEVRKDKNSPWRREKDGGHHIDIKRHDFKNGKIKVSTRETYEHVRNHGKLSQYVIRMGRASLVASLLFSSKLFGGTPANTQFNETLQQTGLTKSYNSCHQDNPAPTKGSGSGEIGGVGCSVDYIEGLFDSPESLFESEHTFFFPGLEGDSLFSDQELRQILKELAIGIYLHDTVPFFSLHFNEKADLYPVIHPAYEKTLIGQVFSMLDYIMKGYLNGGVFKEEFIYEWQKNPVKIEANPDTLSALINFREYSFENLSGSDRFYIPLRSLVKSRTQLEGLDSEINDRVGDLARLVLDKDLSIEPSIFGDFSKFTNSFRIIARQKNIKKAEELFLVDWDFDVFYTIDPDPEYKIALEQYMKVHGSYPHSYTSLIEAYELIRKKIHDHMVKMPICKKYFSMLGVINFFSHYFMTLKKHKKMPLLPETDFKPLGCPTLFPSLPLLNLREEELHFSFLKATKKVIAAQKSKLTDILYYDKPIDDLFKREVEGVLLKEVWKQITKNVSKPMLRQMEKMEGEITELIQEFAKKNNFLDLLSDTFLKITQINEARFGRPYYTKDVGFFTPKNYFIAVFLDRVFINFLESTLPKKTSLPIKLDVLTLTSEQSTIEIEDGKKIVGGCGMKMKPLKTEFSPIAESLLEFTYSSIQEKPKGSWISVSSNRDHIPEGSMFSLEFTDLPLGAMENKDVLEELLVSNSEKALSEMTKMRQILIAMSSRNKSEFLEFLETSDLESLRDREGRSLLHHSVKQSDPFYTHELLKRNCSVEVADPKGYLPIHYAAMEGNVDQISLVLSQNQRTLEATSNQGATPLIVAVQNGKLEAEEFLCKNGGSVSAKLSNGYTVLHCAAHHGNLSILQALCNGNESGIAKLINQKTNEGITPLMLASQADLSLVQFLVQNGANPQLRSKKGVTALDIAVKRDDLEMCEYLMPISDFSAFTVEIAIRKSSFEINKLLSTKSYYLGYRNAVKDSPLIIALRFANIPLALCIIDLCTIDDLIHQNILKETAIELAVRAGFYEVIEKLLTRGIKIDAKVLLGWSLQTGYKGKNSFIEQKTQEASFTPSELEELLFIAAKAGNHVAISNVLLPLGANLDSLQSQSGWKIEHYLARSDGIFLFRQRYLEPKDPLMRLKNEAGKTLAYIAGENGSLRVLGFLLDLFIEQNIPLEDHYEKEHLLCSVLESGDIEGVSLVLNKTKDPSLVNKPLDDLKRTSAHIAAQIGSKKLLTFLHEQGADLTALDANGRSPLFYAVKSENEETVSFLLEKSSKLNINSEVLFEAASLNSEAIFNQLVQAGSDLNERSNPKQRTALLIAIENHNLQAFIRLIQNGASLICKDKEEWTPLLLASHEGQLEMLETIVSRISRQSLEESTKGNNALHLASIRGHDHCVQFLLDHGFNANQPNIDGKKAQELMRGFSVLAALGVDSYKKAYEYYNKMLMKAIQSDELGEIEKNIDQWPINAYFSINISGQTLRGTVLHILLVGCKKARGLKKLAEKICQRNDFNPSLKDQDEDSYAHLMVYAELDPTQIPILKLEEKNRQNKTPLHLAAAGDSVNCLEQLIKKLRDINPADNAGNTPIFSAIKAKKRENLELLVKNGAHLNHRNKRGVTPLVVACSTATYPMVRYLVEGGACVKKHVRSDTISPLIASFISQKEEISLYLLYHGAELDGVYDGKRLSHLAASEGKVALLRYLAVKGGDIVMPDENGKEPLHYAALQGKIRTLSFFETLGISLETPVEISGSSKEAKLFNLSTPLQLAAGGGTVEAVKWFLKHGANLKKTSEMNILMSSLMNKQSVSKELLLLFKNYVLSCDLKELFSTIEIAIGKDYLESLKVLSDIGFPVHSEFDQGTTGLQLACRYGSINCTEFFLQNGGDLYKTNPQGATPLELAAANSSPEQFRMVLEYAHPDLNKRYQRGETLLHIAARAGGFGHVLLLIKFGADCNLRDAQGQTPLFIAAGKGFKEIVEILMISGADSKLATTFSQKLSEDVANPEIKSIIKYYRELYHKAPKGSTPLHIASQSNCLLAVKLMTELFDIDEANEEGMTPLHLAALHRKLQNIRELLKHDPNANCENKMGRTPLGIACLDSPNLAIAEFLLQSGADSTQSEKGIRLVDIVEKLPERNQFFFLLQHWMKNKGRT